MLAKLRMQRRIRRQLLISDLAKLVAASLFNLNVAITYIRCLAARVLSKLCSAVGSPKLCLVDTWENQWIIPQVPRPTEEVFRWNQIRFLLHFFNVQAHGKVMTVSLEDGLVVNASRVSEKKSNRLNEHISDHVWGFISIYIYFLWKVQHMLWNGSSLDI